MSPGNRERDRGPSRGGRENFSWEKTRMDAYKDNYIGHSVRAPRNGFDDKKDALWWSKKADQNSKKRKRGKIDKEKQQLDDEKRRMKEIEQNMMKTALATGSILPPEHSDIVQATLNTLEKAKMLQKNIFQRDETDGERIKGLGLGKTKKHDFVDINTRMQISGGASNVEIKVEPNANNSVTRVKVKQEVNELEEEKKRKKDRKKKKKKERKEKKKLLKKLKRELKYG
eukprot:maker-scaffold_13-snap-gene-3.62-mRNA-1 protein AED:0.00 eAED:0.00 QI:48/1/1/1/1/1/2/119/227